MPRTARTARAALVATLLLLLAACGVTAGDEADDTTTTTEAERSTTTTEGTTTTEDPTTTSTTTEPDDDERPENDPELAELLITPGDVSELAQVEVEVDPDSEPGFTEAEFCEGQNFTVLPEAQAAIGFQSATGSSGGGSFLAEAIIEFGFAEDASLFLEELISLNELCKDSDPDAAIPATFEEVNGIADEAVRSVLEDDAEVEGLDVVVARQGERIVLLAASGDPILAEALLVEAVERAAP